MTLCYNVNMCKQKKNKYLPLILISLASLLLILPQWLKRDVIFGSDSIFHYNRFYDAAMQIKNGHFSYFISIYGFQQSGRIVNALYGPFFAYLQGILVLLSKNWFAYQLLSRFILGLLAGSSMYALLREARVKLSIALPLAILYLTSFSIQYWSIRQGFSSWGAALLPYCLIPMMRLVLRGKLEFVRLATAVALMLQVHVLSALFLVMMYVPFYIYAFFKTPQRLKLLGQTVLSVVLAILLTLNIWSALLFLRQDNVLLDPFVNPLMGKHTINQASSYWLTRPQALLMLFVLQPAFLFAFWKKLAKWEWVLCLTYLTFLLLSTSYFPWQALVDKGVKFAELIQFPFRFFIPTTILLLLIMGRQLSRLPHWNRLLPLLLSFLVVGAMIEVSQYALDKAEKARDKAYVLQQSKHVYLFENYQKTYSTLFAKDKQDLLQAIQKATPDYVPIYGDLTGKNTYRLYAQQIIAPNPRFEKLVKNGRLAVTWSASQGDKLAVPVFVYQRTEMKLNGVTLRSNDYNLSEIGVPSLSSQAGKNRLELTYREPRSFTISFWVSLIAWFGVLFIKVLDFRKLTSNG